MKDYEIKQNQRSEAVRNEKVARRDPAEVLEKSGITNNNSTHTHTERESNLWKVEKTKRKHRIAQPGVR